MNLTIKQQAFAEYYIELGNATEAYNKAGYKNYKSAGVEANKALNNPKVKEYIDQRLSELSSKRIADATEVLEYLTAVMRREHKEVVVVTIKEEVTKYLPDSDGRMRKQTIKTETPKLVEIPARLCDANKAAELLGKRHCLFTDKLQVEGSGIVQIVDDIPQRGADSG